MNTMSLTLYLNWKIRFSEILFNNKLHSPVRVMDKLMMHDTECLIYCINKNRENPTDTVDRR